MTYEISSPMDSPVAGGQMEVSPQQLTAQGDRFATLGDELRQHATTHPVQRPQLGTAPPARLFAQQLAALTGDAGAAGIVRAWGDGLISLGDNQRAAATTYTNTDADNAENLRRTGQDYPPDS
jgi:hypothetical protein